MILDKGYLLSTRDLCTLEYLPDLIKSGVKSFKIEGRMKSPTYVATVTRIYRKYIDLATKFINNEITEYLIEDEDKNALLQVFNRGGFSSGHLSSKPNKNLIFKDKPNNMGIYLGKITKYNKNKGLINVKLENNVSLGDSISLGNGENKYTISELMLKNANITTGQISQVVTLGRMKGNIRLNDKIYKITDKELSSVASNSYNKEYKKVSLSCTLNIHSNTKINVTIKSLDFNISKNLVYNYIPSQAKTAPITKDSIIKQFNKTSNTCFEFSNIEIFLDNNLFIPTSILNDIRRETISCIEKAIIKSFKRTSNCSTIDTFPQNYCNTKNVQVPKISLLLNVLNLSLNYENLQNIDKIYLPLKYFCNEKFENIINVLSKKAKLYIYMPFIIKDKFIDTIIHKLNQTFKKFDIFGIVVSNISELNILKKTELSKKVDLIANYTFNTYNTHTIQELITLGFSTITLSPELDSNSISEICSSFKNIELIAYSNIPLMTMSYCLLGKSNQCFKQCSHKCLSSNQLHLKDRYGFDFKIIPDNLQTITTIYNSKTTKINYSNFDINSIRIDILDENIDTFSIGDGSF